MFYLLFTCYLAVGCFLITRFSFIKNSGLGYKLLSGLYLLKIFAGVVAGWISIKFFPNNDYWGMNVEGMNEYRLMLSDPGEFFTNIFRSPYQHYEGFFNSVGSYWNDLKNNLILKLLAFCNIFSRGNYYINSLFLNSFGFLGHIALYRVFSQIFKNKKWLIITGCFLLPSTLYYSSAIHKDLFVFTLMGLLCYSVYFSVTDKLTPRRLVVICFSAIGIMLIRNYVVVALFPAMAAFVLSVKTRAKPLFTFAATYISLFLLIILLQWIIPAFQPLKIITRKQNDFSDLPTASTELDMHHLEPNLKSFILNLPQAFNHGFLRPYLRESKKFMLPLAAELFFYEILLMIVLFKGRKQYLKHPFIMCGVCFSISIILITGFIIPNSGSIVRYRSIYLPLFITPMLCALQYKKSRNQNIIF